MSTVSSPKNQALKRLAETTTYQAGVVQSMMSRQVKKITDDCLKQYGITTMQWFVIGTIYDAGEAGIRIVALSKRVDTNVPYMTNTVNLLESKGIVLRAGNPDDSRAKAVKISPAFAPQCTEIEKTLRQTMRQEIYSRIEPAELQVYLNVIHKLSKPS